MEALKALSDTKVVFRLIQAVHHGGLVRSTPKGLLKMQSKLSSFVKLAAPTTKSSTKIGQAVSRCTQEVTTAMQAHYGDLRTAALDTLKSRQFSQESFEQAWEGALKWAKRSLGRKLSHKTVDTSRSVCRTAAFARPVANQISPQRAPAPAPTECRVTDSNTNNEEWITVTSRDRHIRKLVAVSGPADPLSNFFSFRFSHRGIIHGSVEHAYQMHKAQFLGNIRAWNEILAAPDARMAKRTSDNWFKTKEFRGLCQGNVWLKQRLAGWDSRKANVVLSLLREKAQQCRRFENTLCETGTSRLVHNVPDRFWGTGTQNPNTAGTGQNVFGRLLEQVRSELVAGKAPARETKQAAAPVEDRQMRAMPSASDSAEWRGRKQTNGSVPSTEERHTGAKPSSEKCRKTAASVTSVNHGKQPLKLPKGNHGCRKQTAVSVGPKEDRPTGARPSSQAELVSGGRSMTPIGDRLPGKQPSPNMPNGKQRCGKQTAVSVASKEDRPSGAGPSSKVELATRPMIPMEDRLPGKQPSPKMPNGKEGNAKEDCPLGARTASSLAENVDQKEDGRSGARPSSNSQQGQCMAPKEQRCPRPREARKRARQSVSPPQPAKRPCSEANKSGMPTQTPVARPKGSTEGQHRRVLSQMDPHPSISATPTLGNGQLSPIRSALPENSDSPPFSASQPTFASVVSSPPPITSSQPCARSTINDFFGPNTKKIRFSPLRSPTSGETFVYPNNTRMTKTNTKSIWRLPKITKPILIVGDSLLSSICHIRQSVANLTQIVSYPGAKYAHLYDIFKKLQDPQNQVKHLILSIGINNRGQNAFKTANKDIGSLIYQARWKFPNAKIYYTSIKNPSLHGEELKNINEQEKTWHTNPSITILTPITNVITTDGLHWDRSTGKHMCDKWLDQLDLKN